MLPIKNLAISGIIIMFLLNIPVNTFSQELNIDPRQYVKVLYSKGANHQRRDTLWIWNSDTLSFLPNQKIKLIDMNGIINIEFDRLGIINNRYFEGTVSLEAELSGVSGTRKIEVNPYSEVGVQRKPIGIKSEPPSEIIKKLLNMILELRSLSDFYSTSFYSRISAEDKITYNNLSAIKDKLLLDLTTDYDLTKDDAKNFIKNSYTRLYNMSNFENFYGFTDSEFNYKYVINEVDDRIEKIDQGSDDAIIQVNETFNKLHSYYNELFNEDIIEFERRLEDSNYKISLIANYLNSFESGGEDALKAFLVLINKDLINYNSLKTSLLKSRDEIAKIKLEGETSIRHTTIVSRTQDLNKSFQKLKEFTEFRGSILESKINEIIKENKVQLYYSRPLGRDIIVDTTPDSTLTFLNPSTTYDYESKIKFAIIEKYNSDISKKLSREAGEIIYKRLVYATIDVGNSGGKSGEVLNLYLTWILDSKNDSIGNSPRLPIGKYFIRETGWKMEVSDMFSLVKRYNESAFDSVRLSPTNFKGAGGAVLMWTFNEVDRGMIVKNRSGNRIIRKRNSFINFFEPSFGLNVSYLDFDRTKDVEIGTGIQLGLFKNKIFFGYGANLHLLRPKEQSPYYLYIGFSFANLSDLFQNSNSVISLY